MSKPSANFEFGAKQPCVILVDVKKSMLDNGSSLPRFGVGSAEDGPRQVVL